MTTTELKAAHDRARSLYTELSNILGDIAMHYDETGDPEKSEFYTMLELDLQRGDSHLQAPEF